MIEEIAEEVSQVEAQEEKDVRAKQYDELLDDVE